jgi:cytochrome P450
MPATQTFPPDKAREVVASFDLRHLPADFYDNPFPYYHALRELDPVHWMPDGSVFLTRYQDLMAVYKDTTTFSSDKKKAFLPIMGDTPIYEHHTTSLVFSDPPAHTRVRRLMQGALTPRHIGAMEAGLEILVDRLLDKLAAKGEVDLVDDYAGAIPVEIIGNLLGVPHDERGPLRDWSLIVLGALEPVLSQEQIDGASHAILAMEDYLERLIAERTAHPRRPGHRHADAPDPGRGRRKTPAQGVDAQLHLPAQRWPRDHHQPDRQWPRRTA